MTDADYRVQVAERLASIETSLKGVCKRLDKMETAQADMSRRMNLFSGGVAALGGVAGVVLTKAWERLFG